MGRLKTNSWHEEQVKSNKKHPKRQKKLQDKEKLTGNVEKSKKTIFGFSTSKISLNETSESSQNESKALKNKLNTKLLQNNLTNFSTTVVKKAKKRKLLSSQISHETLPGSKKSIVGIKRPILEKLENVVNKKQAMKVVKNKKKFIKRNKNAETEKLVGNSPQNKSTNSPASGKKVKKWKQLKSKPGGSAFEKAMETVLNKYKKGVIKETTENKGKKSNKRKRSEENEEIIEPKRRKKSKEDKIPVIDHSPAIKQNDAHNKSKQKLNLNILKRMLNNKKENKEKKRKWENSPSSLRERMLTQLRSSRFRFINETLYNNASFESKKYFKDDPEAFNAYHNGFQQQVDKWPLNPVDTIIESIKKMPKDYIVADFGCGEAKIAESVPQKVHSFDFVALNDKVTACDMAHTPLLKSGVNVVVFCLSLMGTNLNDYLLEANRVLKKGGIMKIAEVESRFENIEEFIKLVRNYGFIVTWTDLSKDLFYFLDFRKENDVEKGKKKLPAIELKSCVYKRR